MRMNERQHKRNAAKPFVGLALWALVLLPSAHAAESPDLDVSTPAIEKLKKTMATREKRIKGWKDKGHVGEARDGLLAVRSLKGVKLAEKKLIEDNLTAENRDRRALYREILKANGLKAKDADRIMKLAAKNRRDKSPKSHWVQKAKDGEWMLVGGQ